MTTLISGLNTTIRGCFAAANGRLYFANGFDTTKVLTPDMGVAAGIAGPVSVIGAPTSTAAGTVTEGTHLIRYRYMDSKTGYVSNPSDAAEIVVAAGGEDLHYHITGGGPIVASADTKCDTIIVEMTPVNSGVFYEAQTALNSAASLDVSADDETLIQQLNSSAEWGSADTFDLFSHDPPPCCPLIVNHKGFIFTGGDVPCTITGTFTQTSDTVSGTGYSVNWAGRLIQVAGSATVYEIVSATTTVITLTAVFAETTVTASATVYVKKPNRLYYSRPGEPESFYLSTWARDMLQGKADRMSAIWSRPDALYVFGRACSDRLAFTTDPGAATSIILNITGNRGAFNQRCLVEANGRLYGWDKQGVYVVDAMPQHISEPIDQTLLDMADFAQSEDFFAGFDPIDRVLLFFFTADGDTYPHYAACCEVDTGKWWIDYFQQAMTACCLVTDSTGQVRLWLGDENGYTWAYSIANKFDGVPDNCPSIVTVAVGSTDTIINVAETLTTSPSLAGVILFNPTTQETGLISSNTASAITLSTALAAGVPTGELWLGRIPWEVRTKWFTSKGLHTKKTPAYFYLSFIPGTATGKLKVQFYVDFSAAPSLIPAGSAYDKLPDGVAVVNGVLTIDLDGGNGDGFVSVPVPYTWRRSLQARITSDRPDGGLEILDMGFRVDSEKETADG